MIRALLLLIPLAAQADTTISAVGALSNDLGYESTGFGIQLDHDARHGNWGWDAQATALRHAKMGASGERYQVIGMGRRYFGQHFLEVGGQWRGYESRFPHSSTWRKQGYAPGLGIGAQQGGAEWTFRYFLRDSTMNETAVIAASVDVMLSETWLFGATLEKWRFDRGRAGTMGMIGVGWRF